MNSRRIDNLIKHASVLRNGCDLDMLLFFHRHPHVLLTGDQLARFLGYDLQQVAASLERLMVTGLVRKSQHTSHPARMYLLANGGGGNGWLDSLLETASTADGRRAVIKALRKSTSGDPGAGSSGPAARIGRNRLRSVS